MACRASEPCRSGEAASPYLTMRPIYGKSPDPEGLGTAILTSRWGTNVPGSLLGGGYPAAGDVAESDRVGVQSCRLAKPIGFLHIGLTENDLGAGCFDRV